MEKKVTPNKFKIELDDPDNVKGEIIDISDNQYFLGINFLQKSKYSEKEKYIDFEFTKKIDKNDLENPQLIIYVNNIVKEIEIIDSKNLSFNSILKILIKLYPNHVVIPLRPVTKFGSSINYADYIENRINNINITSKKLINYIEINYLKKHELTDIQKEKYDSIIKTGNILNNQNVEGLGLIFCYSNLYYPQNFSFLPNNIKYYYVNNNKNLNPDIYSDYISLPFDNKLDVIIIKNGNCEDLFENTKSLIKKIYKLLKKGGIIFIQNGEDIDYDKNLFEKINPQQMNPELFIKSVSEESLILIKKEKRYPNQVYSNQIIKNICTFEDGSIDQEILKSLKTLSKEDTSMMINKTSKDFNYYYIENKLKDDYGVTEEYIRFVFSWFKKYYKIINSNTCPKLYYYAQLVSEDQVNKYKDLILNYFNSKQYKIVRMILGLMVLEK
jgi:hypothetical protein